jgi:signal transduction histidine kinase
MSSDQRDLVAQLDDTESRERGRLAEAVHDEPLQLVVAAMLRLDSLRETLPERARQPLDDIAEMLRVSVDMLRTLTADLTPPDLRTGLGDALERLATAVFLGSATTVHVVGPKHVPLGLEAKVTAYRIAREALVNARKHAQARLVTVELSEDSDSVRLRLTDDGIGIEHLDAGPGHVGVASMRARATAGNALLTIDSAPGRGTIVSLVLPTRPIAQASHRPERSSTRAFTDDVGR